MRDFPQGDPYFDMAWGQEQLKRFTYKPGWRMQLDPPLESLAEFDPDAILSIRFKTEDTYNPGRTVEIGMNQRIPMGMLSKRNEDLFARYLLDAIFKAERHEAQEWLKRDGVIFDNPHK